jgi:flagellar protein FlaH
MVEIAQDAHKTAGVAMISSRNTELDSRMGGGLPQGSLTLIEGVSGSGKSVLSQQMIWGALEQGYRVALFTSENTVKSLISQMESIDLDVLDFLLLSKFNAYPIEPARLGDAALSALLDAIKCEKTSDIVVIDSLTSAIPNNSTNEQIFTFFEECKRLCGGGKTIIVTVHSDAVDHNILDPIRSKCDAHFQLNSEQDGQRLVKTLQVTKIRGAGGVTGSIVGFDVEPGWGMRIIPISKARG